MIMMICSWSSITKSTLAHAQAQLLACAGALLIRTLSCLLETLAYRFTHPIGSRARRLGSRTPSGSGAGAIGYGVHLGSLPAVIISSASLLPNHDRVFATPSRFALVDTIVYGYNSGVTFSSYNPKLCKVYTSELSNAKRLKSICKVEVCGLLKDVLQTFDNGIKAVDVNRLVLDMTSNTTTHLVHSKPACNGILPEPIQEFDHKAVPTMGDFIPWLRFLDKPQMRSMKRSHERSDEFVESILTERRQALPAHELPQDFLQGVLLGVWLHDRVEIIASNDQGNPSYFAFTDTVWLIGNAAKNQVAINPINTMLDAKRLIGRRFFDATVQCDKLWPFKVVAGPGNRPMIVVQYKGKENSLAAEMRSPQ